MMNKKSLSFTKMHGLGNDFIVFNNLAGNIHLTPEQIRLMADRHLGIGCDQVLFLDPAPQSDVDFGYRIFNNDGSESGQCGNGARCLAKFIQHYQLSTKTTFKIATKTTVMELSIIPNGEVKVNMGVPVFIPEKIPLLLEPQQEYQLEILHQSIRFTALSMGNPHVIIPVDNVDVMLIEPLGRAFNQHPLFPEGANVGFMQVLDRQHIKLRVYERGVGETLACASNACATLAAARLHDWVDEKAQTILPGGALTIEWPGDNQALYMTGPATLVFEGQWYWPKIFK